MVFIASYFNAIRAIAGQREPVVLEIVVRNTEQESKLMSVLVKIPFDLGFDSVGLMRQTSRRLGYVGAGEEKKIPLPIYCKRNIKEGQYPIEIHAIIHPDKYDRAVEDMVHKTSLRVISH